MTRLTLTLTSLIAILAATLMPASNVFSQNLPPGPTAVYQSKLPVSGLSGEFDLVSRILEFAPGSATPSHTHGGPVIVTVLEGEISNAVEGKAEQMVKVGESFSEVAGEYAVVGNKGTIKARVSFAVALPMGAALTTVRQAGTPTAVPQPPPPVVEETAVPVVQPVGMPITGQGGMDVLLPLVVLALVCLVIGSSKLVRPTMER